MSAQSLMQDLFNGEAFTTICQEISKEQGDFVIVAAAQYCAREYDQILDRSLSEPYRCEHESWCYPEYIDPMRCVDNHEARHFYLEYWTNKLAKELRSLGHEDHARQIKRHYRDNSYPFSRMVARSMEYRKYYATNIWDNEETAVERAFGPWPSDTSDSCIRFDMEELHPEACRHFLRTNSLGAELYIPNCNPKEGRVFLAKRESKNESKN